MMAQTGLVLVERGEELVLFLVELGFARDPDHLPALVIDLFDVDFFGLPSPQAAGCDAEGSCYAEVPEESGVVPEASPKKAMS